MPTTRELLTEAIREGLQQVQEWKSSRRSIRPYESYPDLDYQKSGLPWMTKASSPPNDYKNALCSRTPNYGWLFDPDPKEKEIPPEEWPAWRAFLDHAEHDLQLSHHFGFDEVDSEAADGPRSRRSAVFGVLYFLSSAVDRMIHMSGDTDFSPEVLDVIFNEWHQATVAEHLPIEILAPLGFLTFEADSIQITEDLTIRRMSDAEQRARYHPALAAPAMAATHAICLRGWMYPSQPLRRWFQPPPEFFDIATDHIDLLCAALRVACDAPIGYAQIAMLHLGWADYWTADLLPMHEFEVRSYAKEFRYRFIFDEPSLIPDAVCRSAVPMYLAFEKQPRMGFAARRLNRAHLRERNDDAVADLAIGLESLLAPENAPEISYRVRMRFGTLARLTSATSPAEAAKRAQRLYDMRSRIVHGDQIPDDELAAAATDGKTLLRIALDGLTRRPDLLTKGALDAALLSGHERAVSSG